MVSSTIAFLGNRMGHQPYIRVFSLIHFCHCFQEAKILRVLTCGVDYWLDTTDCIQVFNMSVSLLL